MRMEDMVNHPSHYTSGSIECIDAIEASMSEQEFLGYLKGNVLKYLWRYDKKNGVEDLKKAIWYINKMSDVLSYYKCDDEEDAWRTTLMKTLNENTRMV